MILNIVVTVLLVAALLAIVTALGVVVIERRHPPAGRFVEVTGGRLHVVELGTPSEAPPVVLLHGASGNLQDMQRTLGELFSDPTTFSLPHAQPISC